MISCFIQSKQLQTKMVSKIWKKLQLRGIFVKKSIETNLKWTKSYIIQLNTYLLACSNHLTTERKKEESLEFIAF